MANMEFLPRIIYLALVLSVLCNFFQYFRGNDIASKTKSSPTVRRALQMNSKLTQAHITIPEGARKVFIDLGANDGASTSYFMNPPEGLNSGSVATQGGDEDSALRGLGSSGDWEIVMFEANINFTLPLEALRTKLLNEKRAKDVKVFAGTAIAKTSGNITFIIDNNKSGQAGATTMPESTSAVGPHFTIPAIGIVDLFHRLGIRHEDFVIVKMDIEGYEFDLIRHILTHGLQLRIDILAAEFHHHNYWVFGKTDKIREKYQSQYKCLTWMTEELHGMRLINWG